MAEAVAGLILAGGKSSRFGSDKASAPFAGRPMVQWVVDALAGACESIVVVHARGQRLPPVESPLPLVMAEDVYEGKGPLAGLVAGLPVVTAPLCFVVSCDAPLVRPELVRLLAAEAIGHDVVCPYVEGFMQPLCAMYRPATCLPVFKEFVEREQLKITAAYGRLDVLILREPEVRVADADLRSFQNANRPEELAKLEALRSEG